MLKIKVSVPEKRDRAAFVEITAGGTTLIEDYAVATAHAKAAKHADSASRIGMSDGHPPFGLYELTARGATPSGAEPEYGATLLLFEPLSGPALQAESYGRFGLLVYAGAAGRDMFLRRTQGGVRLSQRAMDILREHLGTEGEAELQIHALAPSRWWAFWRTPKTPPSLSKDPPRFTAPPLDEASLATTLLRNALRRSRPQRAEDKESDRLSDRDSSTASSSSAGYRGRGGSGGGGGASGSWTDAPAGGRGPGVSAAGVIAGAAGVAAIAAATAADRETPSRGSEETQSSVSVENSGSSAAGAEAAATTTSTAY
jgi:hypothetical protein